MAMATATRVVVGRTATLATMTGISSSSALYRFSNSPFSSTVSLRPCTRKTSYPASGDISFPPTSSVCISCKSSSSNSVQRLTPLPALRRGFTHASSPASSTSGSAVDSIVLQQSHQQQRQSSLSPPSAAVDGEVRTSSTAAAPDVDVDALEIRVGRILKAWKHPEAESLYVEEVDLAEPEGPRTICSGLVKYIPLEELQGKQVLVLANLKARNMRGVKSNGMLLAASNQEHSIIQLLSPPEGATPGERAWFGEPTAQESQSPAGTPNQIQKKKVWETIQPLLKTNDECVATFQSNVMRTSTGVVTCQSLPRANIS